MKGGYLIKTPASPLKVWSSLMFRAESSFVVFSTPVPSNPHLPYRFCKHYNPFPPLKRDWPFSGLNFWCTPCWSLVHIECHLPRAGSVLNVAWYYFRLGTEDRYNYTTVKEEDLNGWVLQGLNSFTKYRVVVQAFNNVGAGPASAGVTVTTAETGQNLCIF